MSKEGNVNERCVGGEKGLTAPDPDIEENVRRCGENRVGGEAKKPKGSSLDDALAGTDTHALSDRHAITSHQFLRAIIRRQCDGKEDEPYHEEGAIMDAAANHFAHFLGDDASHGVDRLKQRAQPLGEIGNGDPISRAQQHDHGFANDPAEAEQDRRYNSGKGRGHDYAPDGLEAIRAKGVGSLEKTAWDIAQRVLS